MGKTIKKVREEFKGLSGTDIKYLKDSIKYGHLDANSKGSSNSKQSKRYAKV